MPIKIVTKKNVPAKKVMTKAVKLAPRKWTLEEIAAKYVGDRTAVTNRIGACKMSFTELMAYYESKKAVVDTFDYFDMGDGWRSTSKENPMRGGIDKPITDLVIVRFKNKYGDE